MYVPILKARRTEMGIIKDLSFCFSEKIVPLIEIINQKKDLIKIIDNIEGKTFFVDFLRISIEKYGNKFNPSSVILSMNISRNEDEYIESLKELLIYDNVIPVISIKDKFEMDESTLKRLYNELSLNHKGIALRITPSYIEKYKNILENILQQKDYLLFDIEETNLLSREIELDELSDLNISAKKILINSPRESRLTNGEFEENGYSLLIDNSVAREYLNRGFSGFGDYCGYKDILPRKNGSRGEGAAIALVYNYNQNAFLSFVEKNTKLGVYGYHKIVNEILRQKDIINDFDNCIAMKKVEEISKRDKKGNWSTWIGITIIRYIYQMYLNS